MTEGRGESRGGVGAEPGLIHARESVLAILGRPGYAFSDGELLANLRAVQELAGAIEALKLGFVAELAARPDPVTGGVRDSAALAFLTEGLNLSRRQANRELAAAAALASASAQLPLMGRALAEGEVTREHVDVAVATLSRVPKALKTKVVVDDGEPEAGRTGAAVIDELLTGQARHLPPTTIERLGRELVHRLDPARAERFDADAFERRSCSIGTDFAGMGLYRLILDPVTHLQVKAVIAKFAAPGPAGRTVTAEGEELGVRDARTAGQRQADAVVDLLLAGAGAGDASRPAPSAGEEASTPPGGAGSTGGAGAPDGDSGPATAGRAFGAGALAEICVIATLDQLAAAFGADDPAAAGAGLARMSLAGRSGGYPGSTIHPAVLARLSCDSPIRRILVDENGAILHHGRARRFASTPQKRALAVRDGGCAIPGCHAPPEWSDVHHVIPWECGGRTDVDAMALLCPRHHTAHHAGIYDIDMRGGVPWVRLPAWQDPHRRWLRNTTHDHARLADAAARTLLRRPAPPWGPEQAAPGAA
jgi:hypothetical protein